MKTSGSSVGAKKNFYFKHYAKREMNRNLPEEKDFCERMKCSSPGLGKADAGEMNFQRLLRSLPAGSPRRTHSSLRLSRRFCFGPAGRASCRRSRTGSTALWSCQRPPPLPQTGVDSIMEMPTVAPALLSAPMTGHAETSGGTHKRCRPFQGCHTCKICLGNFPRTTLPAASRG